MYTWWPNLAGHCGRRCTWSGVTSSILHTYDCKHVYSDERWHALLAVLIQYLSCRRSIRGVHSPTGARALLGLWSWCLRSTLSRGRCIDMPRRL